MVHGLEIPEHEEMKHLASKIRSAFTFPRAQVFQIHAPPHSSGNCYLFRRQCNVTRHIIMSCNQFNTNNLCHMKFVAVFNTVVKYEVLLVHVR